MTTIQPGDKVQFRPDPLYAPRPDGFASGTVTDIVTQGARQFALIRRDDNSIDWMDVRELTPLSTEAIMRAVRAERFDEVDRENVIASLSSEFEKDWPTLADFPDGEDMFSQYPVAGCIADVVSDYPAAMALGDMSAAELI